MAVRELAAAAALPARYARNCAASCASSGVCRAVVEAGAAVEVEAACAVSAGFFPLTERERARLAYWLRESRSAPPGPLGHKLDRWPPPQCVHLTLSFGHLSRVCCMDPQLKHGLDPSPRGAPVSPPLLPPGLGRPLAEKAPIAGCATDLTSALTCSSIS